jgi:hypothetical protein
MHVSRHGRSTEDSNYQAIPAILDWPVGLELPGSFRLLLLRYERKLVQRPVFLAFPILAKQVMRKSSGVHAAHHASKRVGQAGN